MGGIAINPIFIAYILKSKPNTLNQSQLGREANDIRNRLLQSIWKG